MGYGQRDVSESHVLLHADFWLLFEREVRAGAWDCHFDADLMTVTLRKDAQLYNDSSKFLVRREAGLRFASNHSTWVELVLGASKELASGSPGASCTVLREASLLEAFQDYIQHLDFFHKVAGAMEAKGEAVRPFGQDTSEIHDIDKFDPVMMVAYSERFEDQVSTTLWDVCVSHHTRINPHHQAHCVWHGACDCDCCDATRLRRDAMREMVCDKVSRRVQKDLGGRLDAQTMWDVDDGFFSGLPEEYMDKARQLMRRLKDKSQ